MYFEHIIGKAEQFDKSLFKAICKIEGYIDFETIIDIKYSSFLDENGYAIYSALILYSRKD
jgi:hypothetical protein